MYSKTPIQPMLAKPYGTQAVQGWLMSEKLDGVRAIWNGVQLISRNGNAFAAPEWFLAQLPKDMALDGELFIARGQFQKTAGIVRTKTPVDADWQQLTYQVFDAPLVAGRFETRLKAAADALTGCAVAAIVQQTVCNGARHLDEHYQSLLAVGAEGLMLRKPGSAYEQKRSAALLKYKPFESDEAVVIGHEDGAGRLAGLTGALVCRWKDKVFNVGAGLNDEQRFSPPTVGAAITFSFCGLTDGGVPRFPAFISARDYE